MPIFDCRLVASRTFGVREGPQSEINRHSAIGNQISVMAKEDFKILGVKRDAKPEEIKAYWRLP